MYEHDQMWLTSDAAFFFKKKMDNHVFFAHYYPLPHQAYIQGALPTVDLKSLPPLICTYSIDYIAKLRFTDHPLSRQILKYQRYSASNRRVNTSRHVDGGREGPMTCNLSPQFGSRMIGSQPWNVGSLSGDFWDHPPMFSDKSTPKDGT